MPQDAEVKSFRSSSQLDFWRLWENCFKSRHLSKGSALIISRRSCLPHLALFNPGLPQRCCFGASHIVSRDFRAEGSC